MDYNRSLNNSFSFNACEAVVYDGLAKFANDYRAPHGVITLTICIFGIVFNIINVIVLLNPKMKSTVNILLTFLSITEITLLTVYIPFNIMFNINLPKGSPPYTTPSLTAAYYLLFYVNVAVILHLSAIWLIITTAFFRFLLVQFPIPAVKWCTHRKSVAAGVLTVLGSVVCSIPNILMNVVGDVRYIAPNLQRDCFFKRNPEKIYYSTIPSNYASNNPWARGLNRWFFATIGKFLPCILLAIFTAFLIKVLNEAEKRHKRLHSSLKSHSKSTNGGSKKSNSSTPSRNTEYKQTTRMLLAVVILFFAVELPHGIFILWAELTKQMGVYHLLGDFIDMLTLTAFSINFILYSVMSQQYRNLFISLLAKPFNVRLKYSRGVGYSGSRRLTLTTCKTEHLVLHSEVHPPNENKDVVVTTSAVKSLEAMTGDDPPAADV